ncbi:hypothetical protein DFH08DRAFT_1047040 [Mycena albidolilacea]|uniref:Uncharacterized protein n=1 Tax=Mycena albidolilacea TaxID=1033008 RepID=A0AAD7EWS2_9AGAR|nr:hypothetical protein DFH08DRAFT_1047040 [Mycena albidolilacea]
MSSMSLFFLPFLQALWRLVRALFGGARRQADPEDGNFLAVHFPAKNAAVVADSIATFKPDFTGVPALALSSMTVGAAFAPDGPISINAAQFHSAPEIPIIMLTSPTLEDLRIIEKEIVKTRLPLGSITNTAHRVHGRTPRKPRGHDKENIANHPSAPRLTHPRVVYPALSPPLGPFTVRLPAPRSHRAANVKSLEDFKPASAEWQQAKEAHLKQARQWTDAVKARRESLPTPSSSSCESKFIARRSSAPIRLPLEQRLRNALAGCASPPVIVPEAAKYALLDTKAFARPGSLTSLDSVSSSTSMESVLACVLEEFEAELESAVWVGLRQFSGGFDEKDLRRNIGLYGVTENWSNVVSLEDY